MKHKISDPAAYREGYGDGLQDRLEGLKDQLWEAIGGPSYPGKTARMRCYWDGYHDAYMQWGDKLIEEY